jgi:hypothetical protein
LDVEVDETLYDNQMIHEITGLSLEVLKSLKI